MRINSNYQIYNSKVQYQPSFSGAKDITFKYLTETKTHCLPQRILVKAKNLISSITPPSLLNLHKQTYEPLLSCKTLDEARNLFPEFREVLDGKILKQTRSRSLGKITEHISLENLSLKLLQDYWAKLVPQETIATEIGLDRTTLQWVNEKLRFPTFPKNYLTFLKASDEKLNAEIAQKTRDFNTANPVQMLKRNKHAAQGCKKQSYREAQAERIKEYDKTHPERKQKIAEFNIEVWNRLPHIKAALKREMSLYHQAYPYISKKEIAGQTLNETEQKMKKTFYKKFWTKYPEYKVEYGEMRKTVSRERKLKQS